MKIRFKAVIAVFLLLSIIPLRDTLSAADGKLKVAFFAPRTEDDLFWGQFVEFMRFACEDLGMELKAYYANGNHVRMVEQVKECIEKYKPSVLVFQNFKMQGSTIIQLGEEAKIPSFVVNAGFQEKEEMGKPREKYKYWIGQITPDDEEAGYRLANILIQNAGRNREGKIEMVALAGNIADGASIERVKGLKRAVKNNPRVDLKQIFNTDWSSAVAEQKFDLFKRSRYPETTAVWAASDSISVGVVQGCKKLGLKPGADVVTGGIDWSQDGFKSVGEGDMNVSLGGHFMEGAWAAIMIYDYFNGADFASEGVVQNSKMAEINRYTANLYTRKLSKQNWGQIDFKRFSKAFNRGLGRYNFSINMILNQIQ